MQLTDELGDEFYAKFYFTAAFCTLGVRTYAYSSGGTDSENHGKRELFVLSCKVYGNCMFSGNYPKYLSETKNYTALYSLYDLYHDDYQHNDYRLDDGIL